MFCSLGKCCRSRPSAMSWWRTPHCCSQAWFISTMRESASLRNSDRGIMEMMSCSRSSLRARAASVCARMAISADSWRFTSSNWAVRRATRLSSSAWATLNACSARFCSVMSLAITSAPVRVPNWSYRQRPLIMAQRSEPSPCEYCSSPMQLCSCSRFSGHRRSKVASSWNSLILWPSSFSAGTPSMSHRRWLICNIVPCASVCHMPSCAASLKSRQRMALASSCWRVLARWARSVRISHMAVPAAGASSSNSQIGSQRSSSCQAAPASQPSMIRMRGRRPHSAFQSTICSSAFLASWLAAAVRPAPEWGKYSTPV